MSSSESGEDFESADEDFDFDLPSKSDECPNLTSESGLGAELVSSAEGAESPPLSAVESKISLHLAESPDAIKGIKPPIELGNSQETVQAQSPVKGNLVAVSQIREEVNEKKIDEEKIDNFLTKVDSITGAKECAPVKPKITKKLGAKLTKEIKPPDEETSLSPKPETKRTEEQATTDQPVSSAETKLIAEGPTEKQTKLAQIIDEQEGDGWGDGWEIEEEDGFEIPISKHAKSVDSGIQSSEDRREMEHGVKFPRPNEQESQGWGGWGGWGVGSLISTATGGVSTFSSQVSSGLSTVIGAPDPVELAAADAKRQVAMPGQTLAAGDHSSLAGLGSLVSGVSSLGSSVINRGLDTLESLGKKTMEVLQDGDPGLKKKRALLFPAEDKPVLSKILREAKEKADHSDKEKEEKAIARRAHFESLFDDFHGMVHLEALEMLSTQCVLKLQAMVAGEFGPGLQDLQETLTQVQDLCELPDDDEDQPVLSPEEFSEKVAKCVRGLNVVISPAKIIQTNNAVYDRLSGLCLKNEQPTAINQTAISSMAEFTAAAIECFHKSAELLLAKHPRSTPDEAESYVELTGHLCARVSAMASEFTQLLTKNSPIANSALITNIFLEASNSCSYMKNACQLLVPILQVGAVAT